VAVAISDLAPSSGEAHGGGTVANGAISVGRVVWAVEVVSRYMPGVKCLARALATQVLLRHYSHQAHLCIGVARRRGSYKPTPG